MIAIYKREFRSYFNSMIGYIFIAAVMAVIGIYFMLLNLNMGYPYFANSLSGTVTVFAFTVPLLTMKSMAEERRSKSDQMLLTYPVSVTSVVLGKFLAMLTVFAIPMLISCLCPLVLSSGGHGSLTIDYSTILMFMFLGALFISIGMYISSLTESQVIAAVGTMAILLILILCDTIISYIPATLNSSIVCTLVIFALFAVCYFASTKSVVPSAVIMGIGIVVTVVCATAFKDWFATGVTELLSLLSVHNVIANFTSYYLFDVKGLLFYTIISALFIFLTIQSVQKRRYR
ncbi:MAG: ABC transporter permease [Oscillospiraceae bacterium]|nr:ABC transporter permease [Oscillospiraceae bacterium]